VLSSGSGITAGQVPGSYCRYAERQALSAALRHRLSTVLLCCSVLIGQRMLARLERGQAHVVPATGPTHVPTTSTICHITTCAVTDSHLAVGTNLALRENHFSIIIRFLPSARSRVAAVADVRRCDDVRRSPRARLARQLPTRLLWGGPRLFASTRQNCQSIRTHSSARR
jgi:hypothetical protein